MKKNVSSATNSTELYKIIKKILMDSAKRGEYIIDRNKCMNFGLIFKDGVYSYSAIDLFCERIFKKNVAKKLKKEVNTLTDDDQAIIDEFLVANNYIKNLPKDISDVDTEKTKYYTMVAHDLKRVVQGIDTIKKEVEIPFYVNELTKDEFPLICLGEATEKEIETWAQRLVAFIEINKEMLTPAAFSPYSQPEGLKVMRVRAPLWTDIIVR